MKTLFTALYSWFLIVCTYFCLWVISDYLLADSVIAFLFFPFALRSGILIHTAKKYWGAVYCAEYSVLLLLITSYPEHSYTTIILLSVLSLPILLIFKNYYVGTEFRRLLLQLLLILLLSLINGIVVQDQPFYFIFLISFAAAILLIPACYLISNFLFGAKWLPLTAALVNKPVILRSKHILIYIILFLLNILIQTALPETFNRFALFYLSIPIILLAFQYGWQGALLGTLLNSIALIGTAHSFSNSEITDLLLTLSAQTITGIFLGLAIQHQRDLNHSLSLELAKNKYLTRQLINAEEAIRKDISRELHDEIGQNITAIRTQANILKRIDDRVQQLRVANIVEQLSLNIYDTMKGLLNRIRPRLLDDLDLQQALQNLIIELDFASHRIEVDFQWQKTDHIALDHVLEITIYRLCQESLTNIVKYAQASKVSMTVIIGDKILLTIADNGIGFDRNKIADSGFGIRGMQERVSMLGGEFSLHSKTLVQTPQQHGTTIQITLPRV
ncbi:signal transduction histidine-protein kinase/phosphatase UhpB [Gallibacterium salpingitidis]|uniref:Oxygen sensor histidine kinase NreB n=1 Tax=Gallibacterium salpingitidis TaxID=505341 RepID=A0A1A7NM52_9PAST|nr:signal transduction histidine-protein kinase/phosphatase UhpB [Gallibacterium salpingitidis]OBW91207.1 histidine kinase [Gallibacterium salpingitidis]